uniref:RNA helicase n=1 Tax=Yersinia enterocolitica W22703 TaxID=913028 RepID=F4MYU9_YEREN|nr:hypothetical protein YEW_HU34300 [Yersinia enterocolitica W22703]
MALSLVLSRQNLALAFRPSLPFHPVIKSYCREHNFLSSLTLPAEQLSNLNELGYTEMTPVQAAALPAILNGQDVRAKAKTGSGKTAAFGIGLLDKIAVGEFVTQALVLCPTRELADQVSKELRRLARFTQNIKNPNPVWRPADGPSVGFSGACPAYRRRHAGAYSGAFAQENAGAG